MSAKKFKGAPFGTQSARYCVYNCKTNTSLVNSCASETYTPIFEDFGSQAVQERMPHLPHEDIWENKQFLKTKIGPGTYRIGTFIEELQKKPGSVRGICETREERFKDCQNITPGPGTYGIPSAPLESKRKSLGTCSSRSLQRFPDNIVQQDYGLGPGTYNLKSFTDVLLNRRVSKRGPYDLFSSSRNKPIAYGYFAEPKVVNLNPGEYTKELPKFDEALQRPEKRKQGVFSTIKQYPAIPTERIYLSTLAQCPRPATFPGPGSYEVSPKNPVHEFSTVAPFLSSAPRISKRTEALMNKNHNLVGPGRYSLSSSSQTTSRNGHRSSFISGTKRYPQCPARDKSLQERLKPMNVPLQTRSFLLQPAGPFNGVRICSSA